MQDSKGFCFTQICGELITLSENSEFQQKMQSENFDLEKEEFDAKIRFCFSVQMVPDIYRDPFG